MRKSLLFLAFSISTLFVLGQGSPNAFNYSAVARDGAGTLVTNQAIALQMSVLQSTAVGSLVYQETHNVSTDDYGLFNLIIGSGAIQQGTFSSINWAGDSYYLKIEMDITGSTNYTNMGTTQFLSVPYAMHSKTADSVSNPDYQSLSISNDTLFLTNGGYVILSETLIDSLGIAALGYVAGPQAYQSLSISNDTLFLTNGGYVILSPTSLGAGPGPNAPLASVTTNSVSNITSYTALCGGNITSDGGTAVVERGVCWNTSTSPTINDSRTYDFGGGTGSFDINFSGLQVNTTYYVRAFAVNNTGITYGNELSFTTTALNGAIGANLLPDNGYCSNDTISISSCNGQTSLTYNGHDYDLVEIGGQCWFKENLQTTTFRNGNPIFKNDNGKTILYDSVYFTSLDTNCNYFDQLLDSSLFYDIGSWGSSVYNLENFFTSAYNWPNSDSSTYANPYGALYNYYAVTDPNELCPTGWHVPTDCEWMYLENTLGLTAVEQQATGARGSNQGGMLKSINSWAAPNTWATNNSGFSGFPSGTNNDNSDYFYRGQYPQTVINNCFFYNNYYYYRWDSNTQSTGLSTGNSWWSSDGYHRGLFSTNGQINRNFNGTNTGNQSHDNYKSIRCLKD